jgi:hypothetical protein
MRRVAPLLVLAGCFSPSFHNGDTPCQKSSQCPPHFHCAINSTCWQDGENPDLAATVEDLGTADLAGADLAGADLAGADLSAAIDLAPGPDLLNADFSQPDLQLTCTVPGTLTGALISDFEGNVKVLDSPAGFWFPNTDGTGVVSPSPAVIFTPLPSPRGSSHDGVHTTGTGFTSYGGGVGMVFFPDNFVAFPADASAYSGISFWAMGTSATGQVELGLPTTATRSNCPYCTACNDDFHYNFTLTPGWTQYTVHWADLVQSGFGVPSATFDPARILYIDFQATSHWDFWIDDLAFVP